MLEIKGLDHIVLRTTNLAAMLDFYCGVLNCTLERETSAETGLTQLRAGSALIDLVTVDSNLGRLGGEAPTDGGNNLDHFCLQLETITESQIASHLQQHGVVVGPFENRYGAQGFGRSVYLSDPDGNTVELRSAMLDA